MRMNSTQARIFILEKALKFVAAAIVVVVVAAVVVVVVVRVVFPFC